jgi:hypothetical protein
MIAKPVSMMNDAMIFPPTLTGATSPSEPDEKPGPGAR